MCAIVIGSASGGAIEQQRALPRVAREVGRALEGRTRLDWPAEPGQHGGLSDQEFLIPVLGRNVQFPGNGSGPLLIENLLPGLF